MTQIRIQIFNKKRNRAWRWPTFEFEFSKKNEIGLGGDPNSNLKFQQKNGIWLGGDPNSNLTFQNKKKRNRAWMWPTFEFEFSKTKSKIGHGGDRKSILNIYNKNEIGRGGDRNSNSNFQKHRNIDWRWPKFEYVLCFCFKNKKTQIYTKRKNTNNAKLCL